jgi:hypothetical protein
MPINPDYNVKKIFGFPHLRLRHYQHLLELLLNIPATTAPQAAAKPEFIDMRALMSFDLSISDVTQK